MTTIPDDGAQDHGGAQPLTLDGLRARYGGAWEIIEHGGLHIISAEHRSAGGRAVRYIVAHSVAELAGKLDTAGTVEP